MYDLMYPAMTDAEELQTKLDDAADYLDFFASKLDGIRPRLTSLEDRAASFRAKVVDGVTIDASEAEGAGLGDEATGLFDWAPGVDEKSKTVAWHEYPPARSRNDALLAEYAALLEEVSEAATTVKSRVVV